MASTFKAHIFKQRTVGEREEVKLKIFGPDGQPFDLTNLGGGEPVEPAAPVSSWVIVGPSEQYGPLALGAQNFGPDLEFEVGTKGLAILHASLQAWHPPSQMQIDLTLDPGASQKSLGSIAISQTSPTMVSLNASGLVTSPGDQLSSLGVLLVLGSGLHTVRFSTTGINPGGFYQRVLLAAENLG
jgi:hypothetical protein